MTAADQPTPPKVRTFAPSDLGNGERLAFLHGKDLRWVPPWREWLVWDGRRWDFDKTLEIGRRAKETARSIYVEAQRAEDNRREAIGKWAVQSESRSRVEAMIELAKAEPGIAVPAEALDVDPWVFNCANGTLDLRTGELRPHRREDLLTKTSSVPYDPDARCALWESFLLRIFRDDVALIDYVQRALGYSLTGNTGEQVLHLLHGTGSNGKSTFLEVMALLLGDYGAQADFTTFLDNKDRGPRDDIARLAGARVVRSNEIGENKRFNEALIKSLTGGDIIAARFLYAKTFEFRPQFKLWFAANHKPVIRGTDHAIWRRVRLIPFEVTIGDHEKDPMLLEKLRRELPGILRWAMEGCQAWMERGLAAPDIVLAATEEYREESDMLGAFLEECCELDPSWKVPSTLLYEAFVGWAKRNGEYEMSQNQLGRRLKERGYHDEKSSGVKYRRGLRLKPGALPNTRDAGLFGGRDD